MLFLGFVLDTLGREMSMWCSDWSPNHLPPVLALALSLPGPSPWTQSLGLTLHHCKHYLPTWNLTGGKSRHGWKGYECDMTDLEPTSEIEGEICCAYRGDLLGIQQNLCGPKVACSWHKLQGSYLEANRDDNSFKPRRTTEGLSGSVPAQVGTSDFLLINDPDHIWERCCQSWPMGVALSCIINIFIYCPVLEIHMARLYFCMSRNSFTYMPKNCQANQACKEKAATNAAAFVHVNCVRQCCWNLGHCRGSTATKSEKSAMWDRTSHAG